jgi:hypothetical protein
MMLRDVISRTLDAHPARCIDDAADRAALVDALVEAIRQSPEAQLVRAALGPEPIAFVVRVAGSNGRDQKRLHLASNALAGGD